MSVAALLCGPHWAGRQPHQLSMFVLCYSVPMQARTPLAGKDTRGVSGDITKGLGDTGDGPRRSHDPGEMDSTPAVGLPRSRRTTQH